MIRLKHTLEYYSWSLTSFDTLPIITVMSNVFIAATQSKLQRNQMIEYFRNSLLLSERMTGGILSTANWCCTFCYPWILYKYRCAPNNGYSRIGTAISITNYMQMTVKSCSCDCCVCVCLIIKIIEFVSKSFAFTRTTHNSIHPYMQSGQ